MTTSADDRLPWALEHADIPILLMILVQLTGDRRWLSERYRPRRDVRLFPDESGGLPDEVCDEIRQAVLDLLGGRDGVRPTELSPTDELYAEMMSTCVGEEVPPEYVELFLEEMGLRRTADAAPGPVVPGGPQHVLVIGAGFSGLAAAIRLKAAGYEYSIVDRNSQVGGVWVENTYPDSGVDTPNHFYSYSFRPNLTWSSYFSKQPEVLDYIEDCAAHYGILDEVELETEVVRLRWVEDEQRWHATLRRADANETERAVDAVIVATGHLNQPHIPEFDGLDEFTGTVFHTSRWRHDVDLTGKRVAMIGVGASAIQVARNVAAVASQFTIFQRSPQWVAPNPDYHRRVSPQKQWLLSNVPHYAMWYRFVRFWRYGDGLLASLHKVDGWEHADRSVGPDNDRHRGFYTRYLMSELEGRDDLIEKTLPDYPPFGKRMLVDNEWFTTLRRDNVELVTAGIGRFTPNSIAADDGSEHPVDVVIMATGFHARRYVWPIEAIGRRSLGEIWGDDDARAYLGMTIPEMPNFFVMGGPNTSLAHGGSAIFHAECQANYIVDLLDRMRDEQVRVADLRPEVLDDYIAEVDARHAQLIWTHPGMTNWYRNRAGRVVATTPWRMVDYWRMTRQADLSEYRLERRPG